MHIKITVHAFGFARAYLRQKNIGPIRKNCLFPVTRPTLFYMPDPSYYATKKKKNVSGNATDPAKYLRPYSFLSIKMFTQAIKFEAWSAGKGLTFCLRWSNASKVENRMTQMTGLARSLITRL